MLTVVRTESNAALPSTLACLAKKPSKSPVRSPLTLPDLGNVLRGPVSAFSQLDGIHCQPLRLEPGQAVRLSAEPFDTLYFVRSGLLKTTKHHPLDRHQVIAFPMPGDVLHTDALYGHSLSLQTLALAPCEIILLSRTKRTDAAGAGLASEAAIHRMLIQQVKREQGMQRMLGSLATDARIIRFLVSLAARHAAMDNPGPAVSFPLNMADMASYLNLSVKAVERTLSGCMRAGLLTTEHNTIHIANTNLLGGELVSLVLRDMPPIN